MSTRCARYSALSTLTLVTLCLQLGLAALPAFPAVTQIEIERRVPILGGRDFAGRGAYELIEGQVRFGFDPTSPANARISDLELAPRNAQGRVEASANFAVLQAIDPAKRSGTALLDVANRGRRLALATLNRTQKDFMAPATLAPEAEVDWGDGFLMEEGLTVLWVGWQADAPAFPGAMRLDVPRARHPDGSKIRGLARSDWVVDESRPRLPLAALGHSVHRAADPNSPQNRLTRRRDRESERQLIPRADWRFAEDRSSIEMTPEFEGGWIYELVYVAEDPPVVGLGFAAFRDFAAYARFDERSPFPVDRVVANGSSQSGRFLRHLLYEGFDVDEAGRPVFDAFMIRIGGAGRGGFNHRFSHPGRVGNPYENFFYPGDEFPFSSRPSVSHDPTGSRHAGLLDRVRTRPQAQQPKIFQINTGYEYWGRAAALIHMAPDGRSDVAPLDNERLYHIAAAPHYSLPFPPRPEAQVAPGVYRGSHVDTSAIHRALLLHMLAWVERDVPPPPSKVPSIADGSLVDAATLQYPIGSLVVPRTPHVAYRLDFGPEWPSGIITQQPPKRGAPYAVKVPAIDALGNERTGIRPMELRVPIGTYTPWAVRSGFAQSSDQMIGYLGSFLPLARSVESRAADDRRPTWTSLYSTREAYERRVAAEADAMIAAGWMLARDRPLAVRAAAQRWDWITR